MSACEVAYFCKSEGLRIALLVSGTCIQLTCTGDSQCVQSTQQDPELVLRLSIKYNWIRVASSFS